VEDQRLGHVGEHAVPVAVDLLVGLLFIERALIIDVAAIQLEVVDTP
jgi:hypothetical protein